MCGFISGGRPSRLQSERARGAKAAANAPQRHVHTAEPTRCSIAALSSVGRSRGSPSTIACCIELSAAPHASSCWRQEHRSISLAFLLSLLLPGSRLLEGILVYLQGCLEKAGLTHFAVNKGDRGREGHRSSRKFARHVTEARYLAPGERQLVAVLVFVNVPPHKRHRIEPSFETTFAVLGAMYEALRHERERARWIGKL
eukprot:2629631-Prymnesium_polylepis.3